MMSTSNKMRRTEIPPMFCSTQTKSTVDLVYFRACQFLYYDIYTDILPN